MEFVRSSRGGKGRIFFSSLPWRLHFNLIRLCLHLLSDLFYLIFVYIWPYRKDLILKNAKKAFPHNSNDQKNRFLRKYYRHLADLITEPFLISLCLQQDLHRLVRYENVALLRNLIKEGKDVVLMGSHCGNWEYLLSLPLQTDAEIFAAYSPVSQSFLNHKLKSIRGKFGIQLVPKHDWHRKTLKHEASKPVIFLSITDQRPASPGKCSLMFLNQTTCIQSGAARLAIKRSAAVVYVDVKKRARNSYIFRFEMLSENSEKSCETELMHLYYQHLENTILREPALWLWSHNRWKY